MITRSNLAEQLREYQIRSKHDWASVSFFSSTSSNIATSRVDVVVFVIWELVILAFLVFSIVSFLRHNPIAFVHENYKASKTRKEKETKDASSIVNVKWHQVLTCGIFPILLPPIYRHRILAILDHFHWSRISFITGLHMLAIAAAPIAIVAERRRGMMTPLLRDDL
ncbi:hypothetical protein CR513_51623, partial [Mucuna pruriens]